MRERNELKNIATIIANRFDSRKATLYYLKSIHPEADRVNAMNNILPSGIESLGVTESRMVLRYLDKKYDDCHNTYIVGIKNTKNEEWYVEMERGLA